MKPCKVLGARTSFRGESPNFDSVSPKCSMGTAKGKDSNAPGTPLLSLKAMY